MHQMRISTTGTHAGKSWKFGKKNCGNCIRAGKKTQKYCAMRILTVQIYIYIFVVLLCFG
jgi:hypothetical protein